MNKILIFKIQSLVILCYLFFTSLSCRQSEVAPESNDTIEKSRDVEIVSISMKKITVYEKWGILYDPISDNLFLGDSIVIVVNLQSKLVFPDYFFWNVDSLNGTPIIARVETGRGDVENFILQRGGWLDGNAHVPEDISPLTAYIPYIKIDKFRKGNGFLELSPEGDNLTVSTIYNGVKKTSTRIINKRGD